MKQFLILLLLLTSSVCFGADMQVNGKDFPIGQIMTQGDSAIAHLDGHYSIVVRANYEDEDSCEYTNINIVVTNLETGEVFAL